MARSVMQRVEVLVPHEMLDAVAADAKQRGESLSMYFALAAAKRAKVKFVPPKLGRPNKKSAQKPAI